MSEAEPLFTPDELQEWRRRIAEANRHNVLCHCRRCAYEWVASEPSAYKACTSKDIEFILCWQFPDG